MNNDLKALLEKSEARLDHVAIACEDLEKSVNFYELMGLHFSSEREVVEEQSVKVAFAPIDESARLELLESTDPDGPIGKYISKRGGGIHHICFRVDNIESMMEKLKKEGVTFTSEKPKIGAGNCLVNFIHPKSSGGVLIELSEKQQN